MEKNRLIPAALLFLGTLLFLLPGCRKKEYVLRPPAAEALRDEPAPPEDTPTGKITLSRVDQDTEEEEKTEKELQDPTLEGFSFSGPLFLQRILPSSRILPEGDYCGPFLDFQSPDETERLAGKMIYNFLYSFRAGIADKRFLSPGQNRLFLEELEEYKSLGKDMTSYSVGGFVRSGDRGRIRVRLFFPEVSLPGTLYLIQTGGKWYLEDWEIPFGRLAEEERSESES